MVVPFLLLMAGLSLLACQGPGLEPKTRNLSIIMGEGEILQAVGGEDKLTGEFHRWEPSVLVAFKGDTIKLKVTNPRGNAHSFGLPAFGVTTPRLEPRGGTAEATFVLNEAGVFTWVCALPHDHDKNNCDLDHARMTGQFIVLER